jgi:hypothetical protein
LREFVVSNEPTSTNQQRINRAQKRPNKSQVRAAQTRSEHTAAAPLEMTSEMVAVPAAPTVSTVHKQPLTQAQRRAIQRGSVARGSGLPVGVAPLTREEEMQMVRDDLRRLLIIAGILLVGMLSLLFVID